MTRQTKRILWTVGMAVAVPVAAIAGVGILLLITVTLGEYLPAIVPLAFASAIGAAMTWTWPGWKP